MIEKINKCTLNIHLLVICIQHLEEQLEGEKSLNESLKGQVTALEKRIGLEEEKLARLEETKLELIAALEEENLCRIVCWCAGSRLVGRSRKRWIDTVKECLGK